MAGLKGRLDVLVNNAGWSKIEPVAEMSPQTWQRCLDVDLTGTFVCMRYALPAMIAGGGGSIINISSIAAWEMSTEHGAAYSAAKAGVLALTRVAAAENGAHGVRVNAVAPGLIYNDFLRKIYPEEFFDNYVADKAFLGRIGRPADIASMVSFLASDEASYITGEVFTVSEACRLVDDSPLWWPASRLVSAYRDRTMSPVEVAELAQKRIDEINPTLHAFILPTPELAHRQAGAAEAAYRNGRAGPLAGVPVSIKDAFHIEGHVTTLGSLAHAGEMAGTDSGAVSRLRRAGAVFVGKTNVSEFCQSATTDNLLGPDTANPFDPSRTAGGSSGGAAASVASGTCTLGLGSDGGGSIRIPASFCGLVGFKPTYGTIDDAGGFKAFSPFISVGPLARTVADARCLHTVLDAGGSGNTTTPDAVGARRVAWCPNPEGRPVGHRSRRCSRGSGGEAGRGRAPRRPRRAGPPRMGGDLRTTGTGRGGAAPRAPARRSARADEVPAAFTPGGCGPRPSGARRGTLGPGGIPASEWTGTSATTT